MCNCTVGLPFDGRGIAPSPKMRGRSPLGFDNTPERFVSGDFSTTHRAGAIPARQQPQQQGERMLPHLTELADFLVQRIGRAQAKDPALFPGIPRNIARLEAAHGLIVQTLGESGDGQTNGQDAGG